MSALSLHRTLDAIPTASAAESAAAVELAIWLYQRGKVSHALATHIAGLERFAFQKVLADRGIPVNYDVSDFEEDQRSHDQLFRS